MLNNMLGHRPIIGIPKAAMACSVLWKETGMARYDLTDFKWSVIEPLLPTKVRGVSGWTTVGHLLAAAHGRAVGGHTGALWPAHDVCEPLQPVASGGSLA